MKKLLVTVALLAAVSCAFGQGKVKMLNDSGSLATLTTDTTHILAADTSLAGLTVGNTPRPLSQVLTVGFYGGTSSSSLFLYSTSTMNSTIANSSGSYGPVSIILAANGTTGALAIPGIASGTAITSATPYFQVRFWTGAFASYEAAVAQAVDTEHNVYTGLSAEFQMNPGPSTTYTAIAPSVNSTWTDGAIVLKTVLPVPEPATLALFGLGAAAMLIFRRRQ
jgi:hypothetical protein